MYLRIGLCGLLLTVCATAGAQTLYKWKDANGVSHYSETPPTDHSYQTQTVYNRTTGGGEVTDSAKPSAESAQCQTARKNLAVLNGKGKVMEDSDGDGKPDTPLDSSQIDAQRGIAEAAIKAYCTPTSGSADQ